MRVAIVTTQVPFLTGGAEYLAASLENALIARGIDADIVSLPFKWYPPERVLDAMVMARLADLSEVNGERIDRLITLKFPAYYVPHDNKVAWLLHQHRQAYELFETPAGDLHQSEIGRQVAAEIKRWDGAYLREHRAIYTISRTVTDRLRKYNDIGSEALYPPPPEMERLRSGEYGRYILYPGRFDLLKRQHLIVEAMEQAPEGLRLVLFGPTLGAYATALLERIARAKRGNIEMLGQIAPERKIELYANCLAVYNGVLGEDYGYVTLEAFLCAKPVICHPDAGGPLEFVSDGENGYVVPAEPAAIAEKLHRLWENRAQAADMGRAGAALVAGKRISWDAVLDRLL